MYVNEQALFIIAQTRQQELLAEAEIRRLLRQGPERKAEAAALTGPGQKWFDRVKFNISQVW